MTKPSDAPERQHFNAARLRSYTWNQLKLQAIALDEGKADPGVAKELLSELLTIELYWAFPGMDRVRQLQELVHSKQWHTFLIAVEQVLRNLVSGSFRNDPVSTEGLLKGPEENEDRGQRLGADSARRHRGGAHRAGCIDRASIQPQPTSLCCALRPTISEPQCKRIAPAVLTCLRRIGLEFRQ